MTGREPRRKIGLPRSSRYRNADLLNALRGGKGPQRLVMQCERDILAVVVDGGRMYYRGPDAGEVIVTASGFTVAWVDAATQQRKVQADVADWPVGCRRCPEGTHLLNASDVVRAGIRADDTGRYVVQVGSVAATPPPPIA